MELSQKKIYLQNAWQLKKKKPVKTFLIRLCEKDAG